MVQMFMRDLKKVFALECPLWGGFIVQDSLGIRPGQKFFIRFREVSDLEDVRFREVPLCYYNMPPNKDLEVSYLCKKVAVLFL